MTHCKKAAVYFSISCTLMAYSVINFTISWDLLMLSSFPYYFGELTIQIRAEGMMYACLSGWPSALKQSLSSISRRIVSQSSAKRVLPLFCLWRFRESPSMSSDPSSSSSTTLRTSPSPCRCITLPLAQLDKVGRERWELVLQALSITLTELS